MAGSGINPQERLPFLATYLGHRDIHSTLVYITVTQDLLQEAGSASAASERTVCRSRERCSHEEDRPLARTAARVLR